NNGSTAGNTVPYYIRNIQVEIGDEMTDYEAPNTSTRKNITIPNGSSGNRMFLANWTKQYSISYDLDGGTITSQPLDYTSLTDNFTLPAPTKEGYRFLGWTGGKNQFDLSLKNSTGEMNSIDNGFILTSNEEIETPERRIQFGFPKPLSPGDYTISANISDNEIGDLSNLRFVIKREDHSNIGNTHSFADPTFHIDEEGYNIYIFILNQVETGKSVSIKNIQIEEGTTATTYESYISTPTETITIAKGSTGNRLYRANWIKQYQLDINHFESGTWIDRNVSSDSRYTHLKYDVYINGVLKKTQVSDFNVYYDEGTTYEIKNITYDTDKYELITGASVNTGTDNFSFNNGLSGTLSQSLVNRGTDNIKINIELKEKTS
ncbi:MAG: InlB B-repeat-containing protein, partial [Bacilli bacterium]|nr:InlB B-repeat-containing protein [Bacilli bacterium]